MFAHAGNIQSESNGTSSHHGNSNGSIIDSAVCYELLFITRVHSSTCHLGKSNSCSYNMFRCNLLAAGSQRRRMDSNGIGRVRGGLMDAYCAPGSPTDAYASVSASSHKGLRTPLALAIARWFLCYQFL
jgi:hypothetical protein